MPVTRLLDEIRELGYTGSANLLVRYLNQPRRDRSGRTTRRHHLISVRADHETDPKQFAGALCPQARVGRVEYEAEIVNVIV